MNNVVPYLIQIGSIGDKDTGFITVAQSPEIPFMVKRVYWTYYTPEGTIRGHHAHKNLNQVIFAASGCIKFKLENKVGTTFEFILDHPSKGLYIPPGFWRTIELTKDSVLLCLASDEYDESDYIREYSTFKGK
jgi:dTDP-4-dehydrorhamnose 3,5-epimerase-like enzyme